MLTRTLLNVMFVWTFPVTLCFVHDLSVDYASRRNMVPSFHVIIHNHGIGCYVCTICTWKKTPVKCRISSICWHSCQNKWTWVWSMTVGHNDCHTNSPALVAKRLSLALAAVFAGSPMLSCPLPDDVGDYRKRSCVSFLRPPVTQWRYTHTCFFSSIQLQVWKHTKSRD